MRLYMSLIFIYVNTLFVSLRVLSLIGKIPLIWRDFGDKQCHLIQILFCTKAHPFNSFSFIGRTVSQNRTKFTVNGPTKSLIMRQLLQ